MYIYGCVCICVFCMFVFVYGYQIKLQQTKVYFEKKMNIIKNSRENGEKFHGYVENKTMLCMFNISSNLCSLNWEFEVLQHNNCYGKVK